MRVKWFIKHYIWIKVKYSFAVHSVTLVRIALCTFWKAWYCPIQFRKRVVGHAVSSPKLHAKMLLSQWDWKRWQKKIHSLCQLKSEDTRSWNRFNRSHYKSIYSVCMYSAVTLPTIHELETVHYITVWIRIYLDLVNASVCYTKHVCVGSGSDSCY